MLYDVFISFRFSEAHKEALALKAFLERLGLTVFLSDYKPGENLGKGIAEALQNCRIVVVLASKTYGLATNDMFDTGREVKFVLDQKKPFFFVRMIPFGENWSEAETTLAFPSSIMQVLWLPGTPMPDGLAEDVVKRLAALPGASSSTAPSTSPAASSAAARPPQPSNAAGQLPITVSPAASHATSVMVRDGGINVFISLRLSESQAEALILKADLEGRGLTVFLSDFKPGEKLFVAIADAADKCELFVVLATATYGRATNDRFDTSKELGFIIDSKKPFFLVKMCDRYEEATARFQLDSGIMWEQWTPGQPMPDGLADKVCARLDDVRATRGSFRQAPPHDGLARGYSSDSRQVGPNVRPGNFVDGTLEPGAAHFWATHPDPEDFPAARYHPFDDPFSDVESPAVGRLQRDLIERKMPSCPVKKSSNLRKGGMGGVSPGPNVALAVLSTSTPAQQCNVQVVPPTSLASASGGAAVAAGTSTLSAALVARATNAAAKMPIPPAAPPMVAPPPPNEGSRISVMDLSDRYVSMVSGELAQGRVLSREPIVANMPLASQYGPPPSPSPSTLSATSSSAGLVTTIMTITIEGSLEGPPPFDPEAFKEKLAKKVGFDLRSEHFLVKTAKRRGRKLTQVQTSSDFTVTVDVDEQGYLRHDASSSSTMESDTSDTSVEEQDIVSNSVSLAIQKAMKPLRVTSEAIKVLWTESGSIIVGMEIDLPYALKLFDMHSRGLVDELKIKNCVLGKHSCFGAFPAGANVAEADMQDFREPFRSVIFAPNFFAVLGLPPTVAVDKQQAMQAYKKLAMKVHPDRNTAKRKRVDDAADSEEDAVPAKSAKMEASTSKVGQPSSAVFAPTQAAASGDHTAEMSGTTELWRRGYVGLGSKAAMQKLNAARDEMIDDQRRAAYLRQLPAGDCATLDDRYVQKALSELHWRRQVREGSAIERILDELIGKVELVARRKDSEKGDTSSGTTATDFISNNPRRASSSHGSFPVAMPPASSAARRFRPSATALDGARAYVPRANKLPDKLDMTELDMTELDSPAVSPARSPRRSPLGTRPDGPWPCFGLEC